MAIASSNPAREIFSQPYPKSLNDQDFSRATQPQINFCCDLFGKKNLFADPRWFDQVNAMDIGEYTQYLRYIRDTMPRMRKDRISAVIDSLKSLPDDADQHPNTAPPEAATDRGAWEVSFRRTPDGKVDQATLCMTDGILTVPRGSYAIDTPNRVGNEVTFLSVWIKDDGSRWSVKMYASDELMPLRRVQQYTYLELIGENPEAAAKKYGLEKRRCGICHRKLTRRESRERGIGPVCAERWGWSF